jgi:hypothetical protein
VCGHAIWHKGKSAWVTGKKFSLFIYPSFISYLGYWCEDVMPGLAATFCD